MKTSPLACVCIFFCLGIWIARLIHIPFFFVYTALFLFLLTALLGLEDKFLFSIALSAAIFCAGISRLEQAQTYPFGHILNYLSDQTQKTYLIGKVVTSPEVSPAVYGSQKTSFILRTSAVKIGQNWHAAQGLIQANLYGQKEIEYGAELLLFGSLMRPPGLRNPGGFNYREYLAWQDIFALLHAEAKDAFALAPSNQKFSLAKKIFSVKQKLNRIIFANLDFPQASLLSAILLGERANLSEKMKDLFIHTGTVHILAISGLHVGLVAFILISLFRFLRFPRKLTFIFAMIILASYAFLSGARPSVVRATIMAVTVLFGLLLNRESKIYNSLGLAALVILIVHPQYLFDAGFQLSFLSVISLVYFSPKIENFFPSQSGFRLYLMRAFSVSVAAWLGIAPFVAYYFNIVSPVAILANLVIIPWLFLVVSIGVLFLIFAWIWAPLGAIFAQTSWFTLAGLSKLAEFFARIPLGFLHLQRPELFLFCGYYTLLVLFFNYQKLNLSLAKLGIAAIFSANILVWPPLFKAPADKLTVTFLDVGLGDAIFIEFPYSDGTMLIDGGPLEGERDAARWVILPFLWNKAINKIDALVLTHPDSDHVGGLVGVLENVSVNYLFDNGQAKDSIPYRNYQALVKKDVALYRVIKQGEMIAGLGPVELLVLHPPQPFLSESASDTNNNSLVLKLVYKNVSFLFCGDIEEKAIEQLLSYSPMLKSTVIKIPHHGSNLGQAQDNLLQAVSPKLAVISVDSNNRFRFPAKEVLEGLQRRGTKVYQTSQSGAIIITTDGRNIWAKTMTGLLR